MLRRHRALSLALAFSALAGPALAEPRLPAPAAPSAALSAPAPLLTGRRAEPPRAVREPVRWTAGASNELMGVLSPDGRTLYFVSDAGGTLDLMRQSPVHSGPLPLSAGLGDAAWPQVSPDGRHIAYISFEKDSTGDVCVRGIGELEGEEERCFANATAAEPVVLWWDATSLAVLSRRGLHGNLWLAQQPLDERPPRVLLERNMIGLALSPDRRWLAYVPLDKTTREVGISFSQKTAVGIALQHFDGARGAHEAPVLYVPRLPGVTGSVAFSRSGDYLHFTQFLNDTNRDGVIDGDDNAVQFRVPFRAGVAEPLSLEAEPEQLTSARWDCHYPAPSERVLITSCSHGGSLDVYALPLEGAVPHVWDDARLAGEIAVARDLWTQLLLWARRLTLANDVAQREAMVREMMSLHLELGEYESTIYYAEHRLESEQAKGWGRVVAELAGHRRAELGLIRGETSESYVARERARADGLRAGLSAASASVAALSRLVISEIEDDIGDKGASLATFRALDLRAFDDALLAPLAARRAERLYRLRADRQGLLAVYRALAELPVLGVSGRLEYAQRYLAELARGRTRAARADALHALRPELDGSSELALLVDVDLALLVLSDSTEEAVRHAILALYTQNEDKDRRRALVLATLRAAAKAGTEELQYRFVTAWASSLERRDPERKNAEALYELIVLDRGYGEQRQGNLEEAGRYFLAATETVDSLEAHIGFIETRLDQPGPDAARRLDELYEKRYAEQPDSPVYAFVQAYRIARELPREVDADRHEQAVSQLLESLPEIAEELPKQAQVHQLWGFVLQQRARRQGSSEAAADANRQYLLALDLAKNDERLTAALLHRLGLVQASLGNHGAALPYLQQRDELPHIRPLEELGLRLAIAESARHMDNGELASEQMQVASQLQQETPALARFEPLVLDRRALSLVVAGQAEAARSLYEALDRVLARDTVMLINQVRAKIGFAASALDSNEPAKALPALVQADQLLKKGDELEPTPEVVWSRSLVNDYRYSPLQYQALVAGLRARAEGAQGDYAAALTATSTRVRLLEDRLDESGADEDRLELAEAYHQRAKLQARARDLKAATRSVERGLELSEAFNSSTGGEVNDIGLTLLRDYAELHLYGGVPLSALGLDLPALLRQGYAAICKYRNPRWAQQRFLFKGYLTELALTPGARPPSPESAPPLARTAPP